MNPGEGLSRKRLPFLGLLIAASAGVLCAAFVAFPSWIFLAIAAGSAAVAIRRPGSLPVLILVGAAFGCVQVWQTRESSSFRLLELTGKTPVLVTVRGSVETTPQPYGNEKVRFTVRLESLDAGAGMVPYSASVAVVGPSPGPSRGDRVRVTGGLLSVGGPRNPAEFDPRAWMAQRGIWCELEVKSPRDLVVESPAPPHSIFRIAESCQVWMERTLRAGLEGDAVVGDLLVGMVLGVTTGMPETLQADFRYTGTYHLFSVSGLHVGMIGVILWQVLKLLGVGRRTSVWVIIPALFFYALMTGWKPSSIRAAVMAAIFLIGLGSSRQPVPLNSLCAAGFLILAQWTSELFNAGFQLSFAVVAAILLLSGPVARLVRLALQPDEFLPRQLWRWRERVAFAWGGQFSGLAAVSLAAWVGSLPLTLYYFHMVSFSALAANMVIVPLAFLIMATACVGLAGGVLSTSLAAIFNNANWVFCKVLIAIVQWVATLPGSHVFVGMPLAAPVVVTVFDVGAGGASAIETEGRLWLIDCGSKWEGQQVVSPWLQSRGRFVPDGVVLTHGDARHIGGGADLLQRRPAPVVVESPLDDRSPIRGALHRALSEAGLAKSLHRAGDTIRISPAATLRVIYPPAGLARDVADDKTLVLRLDAQGWRVLFLSDAGPSTLDWMMENAPDELKADVLVQGRHRSGQLPDRAFLERVGATIIVSTATDFPSSESLNQSWCDMVHATGARLLRQDVTGAVFLTLRGESLEASSFLEGADEEVIRRRRR